MINLRNYWPDMSTWCLKINNYIRLTFTDNIEQNTYIQNGSFLSPTISAIDPWSTWTHFWPWFYIRNAFFFMSHLLFPFSFWTFISLFSLDFLFPTSIRFQFVFNSIAVTHLPSFSDFRGPQGHLIDWVNKYRVRRLWIVPWCQIYLLF